MSELFSVEKPLVVYNEFRAQLAEWKEANENIVFEYETPKGNKEARSHIYKMRQSKSSVEKARVAEGKGALDYKRLVDSEGKAIIAEIEQMIQVYQKPINAIEQREKERVEMLKKDLHELQEAGPYTSQNWMSLPLEAMQDRLGEIQDWPIEESIWQEFTGQAAEAKDSSIAQIREAISKREKHDADLAELEQRRKEAAEREQKERDTRIAQEAAERAKREAEEKAEADRNAAEAKAKAEREAAERRELELKLAAERAEREKLEAEQRATQAEEQAKANAAREAEAQAQREKEEAEKREANKQHNAKINNQAVKALLATGITEEQAKAVVTLIAQRKVPNITIAY